MSKPTKQNSHLVKCAEPNCQIWFPLTRENAFQRYCPAHATRQKTTRRASKRKIPEPPVEP